MALGSAIDVPSGYEMPDEKSWRHPRHLVYRYLIPDLREHLAVLEGRVVDVGCGVQPYRQFLGPKVTEHVGVDRRGNFSCPDIEGDALNLPFPDASFDAALSTQVLEHVADPQRALHEVARVLRPGGTLILTCPGTWPHHEAPYDFFRFTRFGLEHLLQQAGFTAVVLKPQGGMWASIGQLLNLELPGRGLVARWFLVPLVNLLARGLEARGARQEMALNWFVRAVRQEAPASSLPGSGPH